MKTYLDLLTDVLTNGHDRQDRTNVGTRSVFGRQIRINLKQSFPLLTTKRVFFKAIAVELLWFIRGDTNVRYLHEHNVHIWDEWADEETGDLGPVYGAQWRAYEGANGRTIDQLQQVIQMIKVDPYSRRLLVCSWNVGCLDQMALPPCHCLFQFYVADGTLSCQLYQRSADIFLGVPFNIASYSLLTMMVAQVCGLQLGEFVHTFGDLHLYHNHIEQAKLQLQRQPRPLPELMLRPRENIEDYTLEDMVLRNYNPHPKIQADIAV